MIHPKEAELVSVVVPVKNGQKFIVDCIQSIKKQTYAQIEILIVDDRSTDETVTLAKKFENVCVYSFGDGIGPAAARNFGMRMAKGEYVAYLDVDDLWDSTKIERQIKVLKSNPRAIATYCGFLEIGDLGAVNSTYSPKEEYVRREFFKNASHSPAPPSCLMVRNNSVSRLVLWDPNLNGIEDIDLIRRITRFGQAVPMANQFTIRRLHNNNLSSTSVLKYYTYNYRHLVKARKEEQIRFCSSLFIQGTLGLAIEATKTLIRKFAINPLLSLYKKLCSLGLR